MARRCPKTLSWLDIVGLMVWCILSDPGISCSNRGEKMYDEWAEASL